MINKGDEVTVGKYQVTIESRTVNEKGEVIFEFLIISPSTGGKLKKRSKMKLIVPKKAAEDYPLTDVTPSKGVLDWVTKPKRSQKLQRI